MRAILVRIGIDHAFGAWNAPVDPSSRRFVYVPIPEGPGTKFYRGSARGFSEIVPALNSFAIAHGLDLTSDLKFPQDLLSRNMHLDPDFEHLTYGDVGDRRGAEIRHLKEDDLLVFYAGLRSIRPQDAQLVYALVGLFVVGEIVPAAQVTPARRHENAHTRKIRFGASDIVVRAKRGQSGRFDRCLPIGEYRDRAYRVRRDVLDAWGGLRVNDGYIQRSARPPAFANPERFHRWYVAQNVGLLARNNEESPTPEVILILLRQPIQSKPNESRDDPFWEFGSFGCTGCHENNVMNSGRVEELTGVRVAFVQGGEHGSRLVFLTPPVSVHRHARCSELRWTPAEMPFRYACAPVLIDNSGHSDFPEFARGLRSGRRTSLVGQLASNFRSRRRPLAPQDAAEIIEVYHQRRQDASTLEIAMTYEQALPASPPHCDRDREGTYRKLLRRAEANRDSTSPRPPQRLSTSCRGKTKQESQKLSAARCSGKRKRTTCCRTPRLPAQKGHRCH